MPYYKYEPQSVLQNSNYKLYCDRLPITDGTIHNIRPDIDMARWCIFNRGTIVISVRVDEFFSLREVGSTYLTMVARNGQRVELSVLISSTQQFVFQNCSLFLEGR
jgi:hypothetical protein